VPQEERIPFDLSRLEYVLLGRAPHLTLLQLPEETDRRIGLKAIQTVGLSGLESRSVPERRRTAIGQHGPRPGPGH
jgi:iron complex transport system ATP-binding protein